MADRSLWQKSHHLWSAAGIQWEQPPKSQPPQPRNTVPPQPRNTVPPPNTVPQQPAAPAPSAAVQPAAHPPWLPPDRADAPWPARIPLPLGAPVFAAPVPDRTAFPAPADSPGQHTDASQDIDASQETWTSQGTWTGQETWTDQDEDAEQETWAGQNVWNDLNTQNDRNDQDIWASSDDRWDDERPPIRPRPSLPLPPGRISRRTATIGVPAVVLVAVAALALALLTGHALRLGPLTATQNRPQPAAAPPMPLAEVALATYPGQQQRGVFQTINRVVAAGNTIVTIGSQTSDGVVRQQFFVSANGGASWHLAPVRTLGGGQPPLGYPAGLLAGGPGGWAAVGQQAIWTSPDGLSWTLAATHGISPQLPGDSVWVMTKTADGFLAGGAGSAGAVIWTSRDGVTWQRITAAQLGLAGPGETVQNIAYATWHGNDVLISGSVARDGQSYSAAWLSTSDGAAWTRVTIPVDHGAGPAISGLGFDASGLIAVRPGRSASGGSDGISYFSPNGRTWHYSATINAAGGWTPGVVKGSDYGFVVSGTTASGQLVAYTSTGTGATWQPTGTLGRASAESVVGATVAPASTIIAVGYTAGDRVSQQPVFLEANTAGSVRPVALPGVVPELAVNSTAVADGQQIAVGSADGYPAVWRKASGGAWTLVSSLAMVSAAPGLRTLTSVTHGPAGWLAAGAPGPVILTSADGTHWGVAAGNITQDLAGVAAVAAASGPAGYIIVGKLVAAGGACVADVWWSPDLIGWTRAHDVNDATGSSQVLAVAAGAHGFVSVGSHEGKPAVWTTANGRSWETIVLPVPVKGDGEVGGTGAVLQQVAINGNRVVALGQAATGTGPGAGTIPFAEVSADGGASWQQAAFSSPGPGTVFTALTADSAGFTAAGLFGANGHRNVAVWTSATGASWAPSQASGLGGAGGWEITALAPDGSAVTGIGSVATQASQQTVTLTLTPPLAAR